MSQHQPDLPSALAGVFLPSFRAGMLFLAVVLGGLSSQACAARDVDTAFGGIERLDPRVDQLVPTDARLEVVAEGFQWVEGPVWHPERGYLLFSDVPANAIYRWDRQGGARLFLKPSGYSGTAPFHGREPGSNGLTFDHRGRLVVCQHGDRRIVRLEPDGRRTVLADRYQGKRLNSPNDVIYRSNGDLYFTDPPFGLPKTFDDPARELAVSGVYRLSSAGVLSLLEGGLKAPNGIAFSPDEKTLYVSDVDPERPAWWAFPVRSDGTLAAGKLLLDASVWRAKRRGGPDGLKVDSQGFLYAAGPEGVYILAPDGAHLGTLFTGVPTGNVAWGDVGSTLYITAGTWVLRIGLNTKGLGF